MRPVKLETDPNVIIIIIISADWRPLLDIGLRQVSPQRLVPYFSHPAGSRDPNVHLGKRLADADDSDQVRTYLVYWTPEGTEVRPTSKEKELWNTLKQYRLYEYLFYWACFTRLL